MLAFALVLFSIAWYLLPWAVANHRKHHNQAAIFVTNLFFGWTFVGWVAALIWACTATPNTTNITQQQA